MTHASLPDRQGDFVKLLEYDVEFAPIKVVKWKSQRTGLNVIWASTPGPLIHTWTTVVTEIFNSSGIPHTLEHLTFMGSEHFPYKGVLDAVANRSFGNGTNAWTEVDNTTYTACTASAEGFLRLLPVYLDHIFFPTLTQSAFETEVFHIDGKGDEGGVVYSEMQGSANSSADLMNTCVRETLYGTGHQNAYSSETGGELEALRVLHLDSIRNFHDKMYEPQNTTLLVTGTLNPVKLLQTLAKTIEADLVAAGLAYEAVSQTWRRPFIDSSTASHTPVIHQDIVKTIAYPAKDESRGEVWLVMVGSDVNDVQMTSAIDLLGSYLAGSDVSPLMKKFVSAENGPYATNVSVDLMTRQPSLLTITLTGVRADCLDGLGEDVHQAIQDLLHVPFDMARMQTLISKTSAVTRSVVEQDPAGWVQTSLIPDIIYGASDGHTLPARLRDLRILDDLARWDSKKWLRLLDRTFVRPHFLTIIGKPSAALARELATKVEADKTRRIEELGRQGLACKARHLNSAQRINEKPIPREIIHSFPVPSVNRITWYRVDTARPGHLPISAHSELQRWLDSTDATDVPFMLQFDECPSASINITMHFQPSKPLGDLLPLYFASFFSLPLVRADGQLLDSDGVTKQLDKDLLWRSIGVAGEGISLALKVEAGQENYENAIAWMHDLLLRSQFQYAVGHLKNVVERAAGDFAVAKEDGAAVASAAERLLAESDLSLSSQVNLLNTFDCLPKILSKLGVRSEEIVAELDNLRRTIWHPQSLRVSVRGNVTSLTQPVKTWLKHFNELASDQVATPSAIIHPFERLSSLGRNPSLKLLLCTSPAGSSSHSRHTALAPSWQHTDHTALQVALAVIGATEGPMWKAVRGAGLAYGAAFDLRVESRHVTFSISDSPNAPAAYKAAGQLIEDLVMGKITITETMLESAKSMLVFDIVQGLATGADAAWAAFANECLLDRPRDYDRELLTALQAVTLDELEQVIPKWIAPIFRPETSFGAASCGSEQSQQTLEGFTAIGYHVEVRKL